MLSPGPRCGGNIPPCSTTSVTTRWILRKQNARSSAFASLDRRHGGALAAAPLLAVQHDPALRGSFEGIDSPQDEQIAITKFAAALSQDAGKGPSRRAIRAGASLDTLAGRSGLTGPR